MKAVFAMVCHFADVMRIDDGKKAASAKAGAVSGHCPQIIRVNSR